jgi:glycerol-3-phosphate acyltransferase PlsX
MAMAHFVLKMLPGVERPAIVSMIPSRGGHTYMLDLGANASCTPVQLCQFAVMGSVLAADLEGSAREAAGRPAQHREPRKSRATTSCRRRIICLMAAADINYVGFVEGHDIFSDARWMSS